MFEGTPEYWQGWRESSNPYRQLKSRRDRELAVDLLQLVEGDTVLEVGCGYGWTTQALVSAATLRWVGVDASLAMLRALRDKVLSGKNGVVVADALRLPFTDAAFDKVLCNGVLPHLEDEVAALREMVRVLSPGGLLVVSMNNALAPYALPVQLRGDTDELGRARGAGHGGRVLHRLSPGGCAGHARRQGAGGGRP